jgi:hypothetical protein
LAAGENPGKDGLGQHYFLVVRLGDYTMPESGCHQLDQCSKQGAASNDIKFFLAAATVGELRRGVQEKGYDGYWLR